MASEHHEDPNGNELEQIQKDVSHSSSGGSDSSESDQVTPVENLPVSESTGERRFEEIRPGDRAELQRIASGLVRSTSFARSTKETRDNTADNELVRKDTLHGVKLGDPVLDPKSSEFDSYKWARM